MKFTQIIIYIKDIMLQYASEALYLNMCQFAQSYRNLNG